MDFEEDKSNFSSISNQMFLENRIFEKKKTDRLNKSSMYSYSVWYYVRVWSKCSYNFTRVLVPTCACWHQAPDDVHFEINLHFSAVYIITNKRTVKYNSIIKICNSFVKQQTLFTFHLSKPRLINTKIDIRGIKY